MSELRPTLQSHEPDSTAAETGLSDVAILDIEGRIIAVNEAWRVTNAAWAGRDAGIGALYVQAIQSRFPDIDRLAFEQCIARLLSGEAAAVRLACVVQNPEGHGLSQLQIMPLVGGEPGRFIAVHTDQTELATTRQALRTASEQLSVARDDERQRIAMELHDSTNQHLVAIGFCVSQLRRMTPGIDETMLDEITKYQSEAIREIRRISYLMTPRGLDAQGMCTTMRQFLEGFARRTRLEVSLETSGSLESVEPDLQHAALRIVQEALLNAERHAHARRVVIELSVNDGLLTVSVADDGRGIGTTQGDACHGVGIPGMRARAQQFLGNLAISSDESGTRIVALLPLN